MMDKVEKKRNAEEEKKQCKEDVKQSVFKRKKRRPKKPKKHTSLKREGPKQKSVKASVMIPSHTLFAAREAVVMHCGYVVMSVIPGTM